MQGGDLKGLLAVVLLLAGATLLPLAHAQSGGVIADFRFDPVSPVAGQPVTFYDESDYGSSRVLRQYWDWGDGTPEAARRNPFTTHSFPAAGTYEVTLTTADFRGNSDSVTKSITVRPPPVPDFTWSIEGARLSVDAGNSTSPYGAVTSFTWQWGDNTTSTEAQATHVYAEPGNYLLNLSIVDEQGNPATLRKGLLLPDAPPSVAFGVSSEPALVGAPTTFTDATRPAFAQLASWTWLLDGTEVATGPAFTQTFNATGRHNVTLRVEDARGHVNETSRDVLVLLAPNATFETSLDRRTVTVDATNASDGDGVIATYAWDWGDGSPTSFGVLAAHEYRAAGDYVINLTVTDDDGATAFATHALQIRGGSAVAAFDVAPSVADVGEEVRFLDASVDPEGPLQAWLWEFGDGETSTQRQTTHVYRAEGRYVVNLTVTDAQGMLTRASRALTVVAPPPPPPPSTAAPPTATVAATPPATLVTEHQPSTPVDASPGPITRAATPASSPAPSAPAGTPGFGLAALALALVGAALALRRR